MSIFVLLASGLGYLVAFVVGAIVAVILTVGRGRREAVSRRVLGPAPAEQLAAQGTELEGAGDER